MSASDFTALLEPCHKPQGAVSVEMEEHIFFVCPRAPRCRRRDRRHAQQLVAKSGVVAPGRRSTDPADLPTELIAFAMRDPDALQRNASTNGELAGTYAVLAWTV